jgi:hypothetical protein
VTRCSSNFRPTAIVYFGLFFDQCRSSPHFFGYNFPRWRSCIHFDIHKRIWLQFGLFNSQTHLATLDQWTLATETPSASPSTRIFWPFFVRLKSLALPGSQC